MTTSPAARVLVVDDSDVNRLLVVETLAPEGIETVEAASGADALARFANGGFDVVLMDVRMPTLDGFQTLQQLRTLPGGDDVPVIFLTALRDIDTFDRARAAGAVDFLTKPVRPTELLARVESALRLRRLGKEVSAQLREIRRQRDDLLRTQLQKERLASFVVHDLKNPLSVMRLNADLIASTPDLDELALESTHAIREQCDRLSLLVMNLLDLAKADEGQLSPQHTDVPCEALARTAAAEYAALAEARQLRIAIDVKDDLVLWADASLVHRVITNLLDNALRHTPKGGEVRLRALRADGHDELRVQDTGPGIPEGLRERIFDPFVQLDPGDASRSGRGLGLAFCRAAVLAHGGTIRVESAERGASFVVTLPVKP